jgi:hypothetical protein
MGEFDGIVEDEFFMGEFFGLVGRGLELVFRRRFYFMGCFGGVLEFEVDSFD